MHEDNFIFWFKRYIPLNDIYTLFYLYKKKEEFDGMRKKMNTHTLDWKGSRIEYLSISLTFIYGYISRLLMNFQFSFRKPPL